MNESPQILDGQGIYIGSDPGSTGAIAVVNADEIAVFDLPLDPNPLGGQALDLKATWSLALSLRALDPRAYVQEHVWGVRGQSGAGQFKFGDTNGVLRALFFASGIRCARPVSSQRWTAALRVGNDKARHVDEAVKLFPRHAHLFTPKRGILTLEQCKGRADAALIAHYGRKFKL